MVSFTSNIIGTVPILLGDDPEKDARIVQGLTQDDLAFLVRDEKKGLRLFILGLAGIRPIDFGDCGTATRTIDLIPFSDGSYCFVYEVANIGVFYSQILRDGTVNIKHRRIADLVDGVFRAINYSLTVFPDNRFALFTLWASSDKVRVTALPFLQSAPPSLDPDLLTIFSPDIGLQDLSKFTLHSRMIAQSANVVLAACLPLQGFQNISGCIYNIDANEATGFQPIFLLPGFSDIVIHDSFDDVIVRDGLWIFHSRPQDENFADPPPGAEYQMVHILAPNSANIEVSSVNILRPIDGFAPQFADGARVPYHNAVFFSGTGDIYSVGTAEFPSIVSATQTTLPLAGEPIQFVHVFDRSKLTVNDSVLIRNPDTAIRESISTDIPEFDTLIRAGAGNATSFYVLSFRLGLVRLIHLTAPYIQIPPASPPGPTFRAKVLVPDMVDIPEGAEVVGTATNDFGEIAIAYISDPDHAPQLYIVAYDKNGTRFGVQHLPTVGMNAVKINIGNPLYGLYSPFDDGNWFVTYSAFDSVDNEGNPLDGANQGIWVASVNRLMIFSPAPYLISGDIDYPWILGFQQDLTNTVTAFPLPGGTKILSFMDVKKSGQRTKVYAKYIDMAVSHNNISQEIPLPQFADFNLEMRVYSAPNAGSEFHQIIAVAGVSSSPDGHHIEQKQIVTLIYDITLKKGNQSVELKIVEI